VTTTDGETWAIDARGLTKSFGTMTVVRGVTLQVPSGTIFAFLRPMTPASPAVGTSKRIQWLALL
jgi:ABC-type transporter Mla maintaining outer membrane lipid asymmetry ATPase subunit MlaF